MAEAATQAKPDDPALLQDLWIWWDKIGNAQARRGDPAGAHAAYARCVAVLRRMVEIDPANAADQYNLAVGHLKLGFTLVDLRQRDNALAALRGGRAIAATLATSFPDKTQFKQLLAKFDELLP